MTHGFSLAAVSLALTATLLLMVNGCHAQPESAMKRYDLDRGGHSVRLPKPLREISGLTTAPDGRVFAHNDERGVVYRIDPMTGSILSWFHLGRTVVTEDFEGIAATKSRMYMVTSGGEIYEFRRAGEGQRVEYRIHRTPLDRDNDVEGLCYDARSNSLLLACKGDAGKGFKDSRAVYSFSLKDRKLRAKPRFVLDEGRLNDEARGKHFRPSGIERHPFTGTFFLLAAEGESLAEISPDGSIIAQHKLPKDRHPQAEGITFLPNGDMLISDEGKKSGTLTIYSYQK